MISSCAGNLSEIPAVSIFKVKRLFSSADTQRTHASGSMAGIFCNAHLLLPQNLVGITGLAVRFLIRQQENMLRMFLSSSLCIPGPTGMFAV